MRYKNVVKAVFRDRPNRFIANVELDGRNETVHIKNTGRCRELLIPGCSVILAGSDNRKRKTRYDLVSVYKPSTGVLFNIDSQAPNRIVKEYLENECSFDLIKPEHTYGGSRIDFYMEKGQQKYLMEVKGCTLEIDGKGYFPDAPTERGARHIRELIRAKREGYNAIICFVIQMAGVTEVEANRATDPSFADALSEAKKEGVEILLLKTEVKEDSVTYIVP
ncbi:MAG: DNA/RNA nuclease SfsA [Clostridia bacterium]|nr:DNA/RNA nuclease SfsA [Clostridia bacterium]